MCRIPTRFVWRSNAAAADRRQAPPVALTLPAHVRARDKAVQPHSLDTYDQLKKVGHDES